MTHKVNAALHAYVTRVAFNITLSASMIKALEEVRLMEKITPISKVPAPGFWADNERRLRPPWSHWTVGLRSIMSRGLVTHTDPTKMTPKWSRYPFNLTEAGRLTCLLLVEAGLMQPISEALKEAKAVLKSHKDAA